MWNQFLSSLAPCRARGASSIQNNCPSFRLMSRMSNFAMETILGKGFPQAQVPREPAHYIEDCRISKLQMRLYKNFNPIIRALSKKDHWCFTRDFLKLHWVQWQPSIYFWSFERNSIVYSVLTLIYNKKNILFFFMK